MNHMRQAGLRWHWFLALAIVAGLAALASASEWSPDGIFASWSPRDEITSLRTEDSKTFDNRDGTRSVVIAGPMLRQVALDAGPLDDSVVEIGSETRNDRCVWYAGANYFRCQHVYSFHELNFGGYVTKLAFFSDTAGTNVLKSSNQWLRDFSDTLLPAGDTWIPEGNQVWQGNLVCDDSGWNEVALDTPFAHAADSSLLMSYWHWNDSVESPAKLYRESYCGILPRAHWGYSVSNRQPALLPSAWRANIRITYVPFAEAADVQTLSILSPVDSVLWRQPCTPKAVVRNNGIAQVSFPVRFDIGGIYHDTFAVTDLQPGAQDTVCFATWTPDSVGSFAVKCSTCLAGDQHTENDMRTGVVSVTYLDVGAYRIVAPAGIVPLGDSVQPDVVVRNYGTSLENPWLVAVISRAGNPVYVESVMQPVNANDSVEVPLSRYWLADSMGDYDVRAWTALPGDMDSTNDAVSDSFRVARRPRYDIAVEAILAPVGTMDTGTTCTPRVRIRNLGDYAQTGVVRFTIIDSSGARQSFPDVRLNQIEPGTTRDTFFLNWTAHHPGQYVARCSLEFAPDDNRANDTLSRFFVVQEPTPWHQVAYLPGGDRHKSVRGGAALTSGGPNLVYALKGNSTREFYSYHVTGDSWSRCCSIPRTRRSARSAALCYSQGTDRVHAASAGSGEFWQYRPEDSTWQRQADVPAGVSGRRPGSGVCLASTDTGCIYLLRGNGTGEFSAFDHNRDTWVSLAPVPAAVSGRGCRAGSCLIAVRDYLYLLKGGGNEFFAYSTLDDTWYNRTPLPIAGTGAGRKTAKAGTSIAHDHDNIYVLKGGKCGDLWWYDTFGDSWVEQRSLPLGPGSRQVADGGALAFAAGRLWALKGNNTREFWAYQPLAAYHPPLATGRSRQVQSQSAVHAQQFAVGVHPNPFANNAMVFCSVPVAGELNLKLYDVNGRLVQTLWSGPRPAGAFSTVLTEPLPLGVYLLRASTSTESTTCQLIHH